MKKNARIKAKPTHKTEHTKKPSLLITIPLILVSLFVLATTIYKITEVILANNLSPRFPKLEIYLTESPIEQINMGATSTEYPNNTVTLTTNEGSTVFESVEIKGRGNTTWGQPKKPYQIKFNNKEDLFGFGKSRKWLLLANYVDTTSLRTDIAFHLEYLLDEPYLMNGKFIELYIDNVYYGLYYLTEKVEIDKSRIDLQDDFGILVELDNIHETSGGCDYDNKNNCIITKNSINKDNESSAKTNFIYSLNKLYVAIQAKDFDSIKKIIDIDSFARYYLLNEFVVNPDAYSSSFFMYKNGLSDKIHAGPGWDFDLSIGNKAWSIAEANDDFHSPFKATPLKSYTNANKTPYMPEISTLFFDLIEVPEFKTRVKEIYQETLSGKGEELLDYIRAEANYIRSAALKDQERWKLKTNFDEEVDYLIDWVAKRYDHFEQTYGTSSNPAPESRPPSKE